MNDRYIKGNFRKQIFATNNGYVIGLFKVRETNDKDLEDYLNKTITFTGYFDELNENETYILYGRLSEHPRYGIQYNVSKYSRVLPETEDGIIEFLSSDLFKGVGLKLAKDIVNTLGADTLNVIMEDNSSLDLVPNLSEIKKQTIIDTLNKYNKSHETIVKLCDLGFTVKESLEIYNFYKEKTLDVISNNIYDVIINISDISFKEIDSIALKNNIDLKDPRRIKALIIYIINLYTFNKGDTYLKRNILYHYLSEYLKEEIDTNLFSDYLSFLDKNLLIKIIDDNIYEYSMYNAEKYISNKLLSLNNKPKNINIGKIIDKLEKETNIIYNEEQKEAISYAILNNFLIITGGPGTGKTTIINAICEIYKKINHLNYETLIKEISLLAPTGRAAKRISEGTLLPSSTIHRFLRWDKETNTFNINQYNPDLSKLVIIDEASMIDTKLFESLLKGLLKDTKIIMVGDYNQLPSVGCGQILKDLIDSSLFPVVNLSKLYRQSDDSYINTLASEIKDGILGDFLSKRDDYEFIECNPLDIKNVIGNKVQELINQGYTSKDIQIMAPMYKGENGIDNLNIMLGSIFNPHNNLQIKYMDYIYKIGDKVLELVNMPDLGIYNGDIGVIENIIYKDKSNSKKDEIYINFEGNIVKYYHKDLANIRHAYAISIHKSQGGEFNTVIIPFTNSYYKMLYKKLIYTGITRAKKKLILVGSSDAFIKGINSNIDSTRNTGLIDMLNYVNNN